MTHDQNHPARLSTSLRVLSADGSPVPVHWVEDLFARMSAILGASSMQQVYGGIDADAVKREWCEALAGFTSDEVARGIASVRLRRFAPNLPEFLHLCRPALDPEVAWLEAVRGMRAKAAHEPFAWSHPAVYWAARAIDVEHQLEDFAKVRKRWAAVLEAEFAKGAWASPPDFTQRTLHAPRQESLPVVPERREAVTAMLHGLQDRLGSPAAQARRHGSDGGYTAAELADQERARRLSEGQP